MCGHTGDKERCTSVRENFVFRFNLFRHIGQQSSLRDTGLVDPPGCWMEYADLQWDVDGFRDSECPFDDLWPCHGHGIMEHASSPFGLLNLDKTGYHQHWLEAKPTYEQVDILFQSRSPTLIFSYISPASSQLSHPFFCFTLLLLLLLFI